MADKCRTQFLGSEDGGEVLALSADVSNQDELKLLIDQTIAHYGRLDVLVNNAGIFQLSSIQEEKYMELYDQVINTNLKSVVALTKLAVPHLIRSKGNIVNVSSVASYKPVST